MQTGEASEVLEAPGWLAGFSTSPHGGGGPTLETKSGRRAGMEVTEA